MYTTVNANGDEVGMDHTYVQVLPAGHYHIWCSLCLVWRGRHKHECPVRFPDKVGLAGAYTPGCRRVSAVQVGKLRGQH